MLLMLRYLRGISGLLAVRLSPIPLFVGSAFGQTSIVSISSAGVIGDGDCGSVVPTVSADGRFIAYSSHATNFAPNDVNGWRDIFVRDAVAGLTEIVSISTTGVASDANCFSPAISADGRFVAFSTSASTLVSDDTNSAYDIFIRDRQAGTTELISRSAAGVLSNGLSQRPSISSDGRFVAFESLATNLASGSTAGIFNIYVRDRQTGTTELVSVSTAGAPGNADSYNPSISADGRFVAFASDATNLVSGDTNNLTDVFVRDRQLGQTLVVSISSSGILGNSSSYQPSISANGLFVAFSSAASNIVLNDTNGFDDIFVRDLTTGQTKIVSISTEGNQANAYCFQPSISSDGSRVTFSSYASTLITNDQGTYDIFVHDRTSGYTQAVTFSNVGEQGNQGSYGPAISADGNFVAYWSGATNLVANDTNGTNDIFISVVQPAPTYAIAFGTGTPGCHGLHVLSAVNAPKIGLPNFTLECTNAPANSLGGWFITDSQDVSGTDVFNVGIKLHVDFLNATEAFVIDSYSDSNGRGSLVIAIPNDTNLVGRTYFAQAVWAWALTVCFNFPMGLSSSNGLAITIQL